MARQKSASLTDAELRLMDVLWDKGPSTVSAVIEALPAKPALAYSTIITTMRILESKGYVRHKKEGRAFLYEPVIDRSEVRRGAVANLVRRFFEGSPDLLMAHLFEGRKISARELERLRKLIQEDRS
jgi:BlaI family transcriptional regulator, penicillinase repressor